MTDQPTTPVAVHVHNTNYAAASATAQASAVPAPLKSMIWTVTTFGPGFTLLPAVLLLPLIDAYRIPGWVRRHNAGRETALAQVRAAHRAGGRLTLTQAVMETEADFEVQDLEQHG